MEKIRRILVLVIIGLFTFACAKPPYLTLNSASSLSFGDQGGTQSISFSTNRDWTVSSSVSWCKVSPSAGGKADGTISFTITCDPNTDYDSRNATVSIRAEELMEIVTITQDSSLGLLVSPLSYDLTNAAQTIAVEIRTNVKYSVDIDSACKDWVTMIGTRSLSTDRLTFSIAANETFSDREGLVSFRQEGGNLSDVLRIRQSQTDAIIPEKTSYTITSEGGVLTVPVRTNTNISVSIPTEALSWVSHLETRALSNREIVLNVASNDGTLGRSTKIIFIGGNTSATIEILQEGSVSNEPIAFKDSFAKMICVEKFDTNGDGEVSYREAAAVTYLGYDSFFGSYQKLVTSFDELQFFINVKQFNGPIFKGAEKMKSITLPPSLDNLGWGTFQDCLSLLEVIIPDGVKEIGSSIFMDCQGLERVSFSNDITTIGSQAFYHCYNLKELSIPPTVKEIGEAAFYCCKSLKEITIPEGIKELRKNTLTSLINIETVNLPSSLEVIDQYALSSSGFKHITIPSRVVFIDNWAFSHCNNLQTIEFLTIEVTLGDGVFEDCSSLHEFTIPPSIVSLGGYVFRSSGLESITIPESVKEIGYDQFWNCLDLSSIKGYYASEDERCLIKDGVLIGFAQKGLRAYSTPKGIREINSSLCSSMGLRNNDELEELTISEGVETIQDRPYGFLHECLRIRVINLPASLKTLPRIGRIGHYYSIYCKAQEPPTSSSSTFENCRNCTVYVPMESVEKYKIAPGWCDVSSNIVGYDF